MEKFPVFIYKKDKYMKKRGAPTMLMLLCMHCTRYVMSYQKDGPGPLLRCYLDRIHYPYFLKDRQYRNLSDASIIKLSCPTCAIVIGTLMIYQKENRPAYHMRPGFFIIKKH